ncbi:mitochondrial import inner membrane translocase subunit TIM16 [Dispira parvispora]|uniref:Mitochondrial import inner membrane translocase subunit TIM16 n=1 Tax=Dispira parvispora TaxID=1520584 RepID=A0A9W8AIZ8_9FUNG|nr:mitochondrial import inner membrane translocase subunit TIM16 [Dispira parvispora]
MSAPRVIVQVLVTGAQIVGRAFVEAYKQAAANSANRHAARGAGDAVTRRTGITIDEACQILNVKKDTPIEEVTKKYNTLFKLNDPKSGGTLYLQSKIFRAKERLELELAKSKQSEGAAESSESTSGSNPPPSQ